ncbi:hypothetical protein V3C99_001873 [Haemonchus contortus]
MPATKRARRYKKPSVEEVDDAIYNWVVKKREENRAVTVKEIRTKANESAAEALNVSPLIWEILMKYQFPLISS